MTTEFKYSSKRTLTLKRCVKLAGSPQALAKAVGLPAKTVYRWISNESCPSPHNVIKVCSYINTTTDHVMAMEDFY